MVHARFLAPLGARNDGFHNKRARDTDGENSLTLFAEPGNTGSFDCGVVRFASDSFAQDDNSLIAEGVACFVASHPFAPSAEEWGTRVYLSLGFGCAKVSIG